MRAGVAVEMGDEMGFGIGWLKGLCISLYSKHETAPKAFSPTGRGGYSCLFGSDVSYLWLMSAQIAIWTSPLARARHNVPRAREASVRTQA